jgi:hypothetical protein
VGIRTSNLLIRSQMLYPVELRAQNLDSPMKWHDDMNKSCRFVPEIFRSKIRCINLALP